GGGDNLLDYSEIPLDGGRGEVLRHHVIHEALQLAISDGLQGDVTQLGKDVRLEGALVGVQSVLRHRVAFPRRLCRHVCCCLVSEYHVRRLLLSRLLVKPFFRIICFRLVFALGDRGTHLQHFGDGLSAHFALPRGRDYDVLVTEGIRCPTFR